MATGSRNPSPGVVDAEVPAPGTVIASKYEVQRVLGVGGMGVVLAARHMQLGQTVAIKFMRNESLADSAAVGRFQREARAVAALSSEHVAKVLDVGTLDNGAPYIVLEYLAGLDLGELLQQSGPMAVGDAVGAVLQACEALAEAHAMGIVHRDLKPSNLFITKRKDGSPLVKVLDFGISKASALNSAASGDTPTASGYIMGSPGYMSPEQVRSAKAADARSDVWSLGVILYELLTGISPFSGETVGDTFARIVSETPAPMRERRPELPEGLSAAVAQCLERNVAQRVQSVADLRVLALALRASGGHAVGRANPAHGGGVGGHDCGAERDVRGSPRGGPAALRATGRRADGLPLATIGREPAQGVRLAPCARRRRGRHARGRRAGKRLRLASAGGRSIAIGGAERAGAVPGGSGRGAHRGRVAAEARRLRDRLRRSVRRRRIAGAGRARGRATRGRPGSRTAPAAPDDGTRPNAATRGQRFARRPPRAPPVAVVATYRRGHGALDGVVAENAFTPRPGGSDDGVRRASASRRPDPSMAARHRVGSARHPRATCAVGPSFGEPVLPRGPRRDAKLRQTKVVDATVEGGAKDLVAIADQSCEPLIGADRLDDLLPCPFGCRVLGNVDVDHARPARSSAPRGLDCAAGT